MSGFQMLKCADEINFSFIQTPAIGWGFYFKYTLR